MFRKLLQVGFTGLALAAPVGLMSQADAHYEPAYYHHHHHGFRVICRWSPHEPWRVYGEYEDRQRANWAAHELRERGQEARVIRA